MVEPDAGPRANITNTPAEGCPAFTEGCPFSKTDASIIPSIVQNLPQTVYEQCPGFKEGCPFKNTDSIEGLYNKMSEMPATHRLGQGSPAAAAVERTLQAVHEQSVALKSKYATSCPVFATSCPFKTVTSGGEPLVQELDGVLNSWGLLDTLNEGSDVAHQPAALETNMSSTVQLSQALKAGTKSVHRAAENVRFVRDFLRGAVPRESYIELLKALYHVYAALERCLDDLPDNLRHCDFSVLRRADTLLADVRYFQGTDVAVVDPPSPAARQYSERLARIADENPLLVLAHAYTRYLGDLSGGQILSRAAVKTYSLPEDGKGVEFYQFNLVGTSAQDVKAFKKSYRASLDALRLSVAQADALVEEANTAFLMNMLIFEERDVAAGHIEKVRNLEEALELVRSNPTPLKFQHAYAGSAPSKGTGKCPFLPASGGADINGNHSETSGSAPRCPWPFIWLHDPSTAIVAHPAKNVVGTVALFGLLRAAWQAPRTTGCVVLAGVVALKSLQISKAHGQPRRTKPTSHDA